MGYIIIYSIIIIFKYSIYINFLQIFENNFKLNSNFKTFVIIDKLIYYNQITIKLFKKIPIPSNFFDILSINQKKEKEYNRILNNYFYLIKSLKNEMPNLIKTHISNNFDSKFQKDFYQILRNHKTLFHSKLNQFNNKINMKILFRFNIIINKFKQISYNIFKQDLNIINEILKLMKKNKQIISIFLK